MFVVFMNFGPSTVLFLENEHTAIIGTRSQDGAKLGMSPSDLPNRCRITIF